MVDLGRMKRLFTAGQVRRLWLRDRHCSYPGCDVPGQWCDAHHLRHWVDGGATDLENAGLLCERHHTVVHSRRYAGRLVRDGVRVAGGVGPDGTAPTTSCSRSAPPENRRDPAPHPARVGGASGVCGCGPFGYGRVMATFVDPGST